MILVWLLLLVFVNVDGWEYNYCQFPNGNLGIRVIEQDCPTPQYGYVCGSIGNFVAICCPVSSFQNTLAGTFQNIPADRELVSGTFGDITETQNYCYIPNGNLGVRVRTGECPTPQYGYACGWIGYSEAFCCPITSFQNTQRDKGLTKGTADYTKNYCYFPNGNVGVRVRTGECPTPQYGYSCGRIGYSEAICCPITSFQNTPNTPGDKALTNGTADDPNKSCQFSNGDTGLCVRQTECTTPESGFSCQSIGNPNGICCPVANVQYQPGSNGPASAAPKSGTPGEVSRRKCKELVDKIPTTSFVYFGTPAKPREFRHMAVLGYGDESNISWDCGGTLISTTHVLTAAHCVIRANPVVIRLGDLDLLNSTEDARPEDFKVKSVRYHDDYRPPAKYHDIAIVELDRPANLSSYVEVACLDTSVSHTETKYTIMGWGKTEFVGTASPILLVGEVMPVNTDVCRSTYGSRQDFYPNGILDEYMICAGGKSDTCQGDSGGPMVVENQDLTKQLKRTIFDIIGVTSFGRPCGLTQDPAVYTRIQPYLSWIEGIVWPDS